LSPSIFEAKKLWTTSTNSKAVDFTKKLLCITQISACFPLEIGDFPFLPSPHQKCQMSLQILKDYGFFPVEVPKEGKGASKANRAAA